MFGAGGFARSADGPGRAVAPALASEDLTMMPGDDLIQACLDELRGAEAMGALLQLVGDRAAELLGTPGRALPPGGARSD